jgi:hypothetical protein
VTSPLRRLVIGSLLAAVALDTGLTAWFSISVERSGTHTSMTWDDWFFVVLTVLAIAGMSAMFLGTRLARPLSLLTLGAYGMWATAIALVPQAWREAVFSIWVDRWVAMIGATIVLVAFVYLFRDKRGNELQEPGAVA